MEQPQPNPVADDMTLFCPSCDYDLTGIESQYCPECGEAFERDLLAERQRSMLISAGEVLGPIFWMAGVCFAVSTLHVTAVFLALGAAIYAILWSAHKTKYWAHRLAMKKMVRDRCAMKNKRAFVVSCAVGLWLAQMTLVGAAIVGGCAMNIAMFAPY